MLLKTLQCLNTLHFFYTFLSWCIFVWVISTFMLLWIEFLRTLIYKFLGWHVLILPGIYLEVESLGHLITLCLIIWENAALFSKADAPFSIPISRVWGFLFLHILSTTIWLFDYSSPSGYEAVSHVILICISLMISDSEHLFMCLLAFGISSLEHWLFRPFAHFEIECFVFNHWVWRFFMYYGPQYLIRYVIFKYVLPLCVFSLSFLDGVIWSPKCLTLMKSNPLIFSLVAHAFGIISQNPLPNLRLWRLILSFLLRVL